MIRVCFPLGRVGSFLGGVGGSYIKNKGANEQTGDLGKSDLQLPKDTCNSIVASALPFLVSIIDLWGKSWVLITSLVWWIWNQKTYSTDNESIWDPHFYFLPWDSTCRKIHTNEIITSKVKQVAWTEPNNKYPVFISVKSYQNAIHFHQKTGVLSEPNTSTLITWTWYELQWVYV